MTAFDQSQKDNNTYPSKYGGGRLNKSHLLILILLSDTIREFLPPWYAYSFNVYPIKVFITD